MVASIERFHCRQLMHNSQFRESSHPAPVSPFPPCLLPQMVETMPQSPEVSKFLDSLKLEDEEGGGAKEGDEEASSQPEAPEDER